MRTEGIYTLIIREGNSLGRHLSLSAAPGPPWGKGLAATGQNPLLTFPEEPQAGGGESMGCLSSINSRVHISPPPSGAFCLMGLDSPFPLSALLAEKEAKQGRSGGRGAWGHSLNPVKAGLFGA